ncbi:MAG TPA: hypothetical protein VFA99_14570 [Acidobacteriaceae bacterium]|nr:hypothetical protein [Acidobacteriaceae bacterium]
MAKPVSIVSTEVTRPMQVGNTSFMLDRLGEDCAPLQFLRELTQNAIEGVLRLPGKTGEVIWDVDWNYHTLTGIFKLSVTDTGVGMTGEEMMQYINALSSSVNVLSSTGNYGVGAKIAAAPKNRHGLLYLSWKDGVGYMIHLWRDPISGNYGLRQLELPDGSYGYWAYVQDDTKPSVIDKHGTMVVLLGNEPEADTMTPPEATPSPSRWITKYLNTRYFSFPDGIKVKAREGWQLPRANTDSNILRTLTGQKSYLEKHAESSGIKELSGATAHWWILKDEDAMTQNSGYIASSGHVAALYQNELYEMVSARQGVARLQNFGVIFGHNRVVVYLQPKNGDGHRLTSNTARTQLLLNGEPLPWSDWAAEFRDDMPKPIAELVDSVAAAASGSDHKQTIRERLKAIVDLFRFSRYRPTPKGKLLIDSENGVAGGRPKPRGEQTDTSDKEPGGKGGRAGDVYSLFLSAGGVPGEEVLVAHEPEVQWVSVENGTRTPPDLEDRAAKYLPQQDLIQANADFRVFNDMIDRWCSRYKQVSGARDVIRDVVQEWFEQQLIETIMGANALRDARQWTFDDVQRLWSEEALTAAVLPRYHVDVAVKRTLGAKLGTLKDKLV